MALSLTFVVLTLLPITSAQTTTAVKETEVQEYASMIIHFILIYLNFNFVIVAFLPTIEYSSESVCVHMSVCACLCVLLCLCVFAP